jgi:hypothetical protein
MVRLFPVFSSAFYTRQLGSTRTKRRLNLKLPVTDCLASRRAGLSTVALFVWILWLPRSDIITCIGACLDGE